MSRIGKAPVNVPSGVTIAQDGKKLTVKGPLGELCMDVHPEINVEIADNTIVVTRPSDVKEHRALHGLTRSLINNMVVGVSEGFKKDLEIKGVGYRASLNGKNLVLNVGYSHPVEMVPPQGITIEVPQQTSIIVKGIDKQAVGQVAANIRAVRQPEPYKGKGIKYTDEVIRRKLGKTGAKK